MQILNKYGWRIILVPVALFVMLYAAFNYDLNPFNGCSMNERQVLLAPGHVMCEPR